MAASGASESRSTYFRQTHPVFMAAVIFGLLYHGWAVFAPESFPYDFLGSVGTFTKYLVESHKIYVNIGYAIVWLIHIAEAIFCFKLCQDKGITDLPTQLRWAVQTLFFGMASFFLLLIYNPSEEESTKEGVDRVKKRN
ncbi:transmembrane protein 254-like [Paroedura picta]|uniref:transmembrane protein 254-like n=1 Tax=Paroedura picta TaxID=143630 RepID=UPI004056CD3E